MTSSDGERSHVETIDVSEIADQLSGIPRHTGGSGY